MLSYPVSFTFISDEVSQEPAVVVAFARRHGFRGFELRSMFGRQFRDLTAADLGEIKRRAEDAGLTVFGCCTPVFKCSIDNAAEVKEHRDIFLRSVEAANMLGCSLLRVFTFLRIPGSGSREILGRVASQINRLLPLCPSALRIGVENEASCVVGTGEEAERFLQAGADGRLGVIWDPCNVLYVGGYAGAAVANFARIAQRVVHIHVKDARREGPTAVALPVGKGQVGWRTHFGEILAAGYRGLFSLETHWRAQGLGPGALHLPGGFGFSAGGESASEICLDEIRAICART